MFNVNDLKTLGTAFIDGTTYVVLDDGPMTCIYDADDLDEDREYADYNEFCQEVVAIDDEDLIRRVCIEVGIPGAHLPGCAVWVPAEEDSEEDEDSEDEPTIWDFDLKDIDIQDGEGNTLTPGSCMSSHDALVACAQRKADHYSQSIYLVSGDWSMEVEPSFTEDGGSEEDDDVDVDVEPIREEVLLPKETAALTSQQAYDKYVGLPVAEFLKDKKDFIPACYDVANSEKLNGLLDIERTQVDHLLQYHVLHELQKLDLVLVEINPNPGATTNGNVYPFNLSVRLNIPRQAVVEGVVVLKDSDEDALSTYLTSLAGIPEKLRLKIQGV